MQDAPAEVSEPATGSLALSQQPTEALRRLALAPTATAADASVEDDDVPAQSMSDFLGGSAASALFDDEPANAAKKNVSALFDDEDTDDEDAGLSEAARARRQLKREQAAAAQRAQAAAQAAAAVAQQEAQVSAPASPSEVAVQTAEPVVAAVGLSAASKRAGGKDLFGADGDDSAPQSRGLDGVFIPRGAAEYRTEAEREVAGAVDPALLVEADDSELERLGGGAAASAQHSGASTIAAAASPAGAAAPAASSAAAAAVVDELDDDLFSFAAPAAKPAVSTVDASAPDFDFQSYLASQKAAATTASTGASLFDDDDD